MRTGPGFAHDGSPSGCESAEAPSWFRAGAPLLLLPLLSACAGPLSALQPEGPGARSAAALWWIMLAGGGVIFATVSAVLTLAILRPGTLRAFGAGRTILWGGLVVPSAVLAALVIAALALGERLLATPRADMPLRIEAVARQWTWEFRYADGSVSFDRLRLPAGRDVDVAVTSADVVHAFWIPRLGGKIDAIPGRETVVRLRADRPGVYGGVCAEFCGTGHSGMAFTVEAREGERTE